MWTESVLEDPEIINHDRYHYCPVRVRRALRQAVGHEVHDELLRVGPDVFFTLLDLCMSCLRGGHANLLCTVPSSMDDSPGGNPDDSVAPYRAREQQVAEG